MGFEALRLEQTFLRHLAIVYLKDLEILREVAGGASLLAAVKQRDNAGREAVQQLSWLQNGPNS
jgi:hypothetical protein